MLDYLTLDQWTSFYRGRSDYVSYMLTNGNFTGRYGAEHRPIRCGCVSSGNIETCITNSCNNFKENRLCFKCTPTCGNKSLSASNIPLYIAWNDRTGWGLHTAVDIPKGIRIIEFMGEVLSEDAAKLRYKNRHSESNFLMSLSSDTDGSELLLDTRDIGNIARFVNHACDAVATCTLIRKIWNLSETRLGLVSAVNIKSHAELTYTYSFKDPFPGNRMACLCHDGCSRYLPLTYTFSGTTAASEAHDLIK